MRNLIHLPARALLPQVALAIYFQVVEWIPLFPWNDLSRGNPQAGLDVAVGVVQAVLIAWTANGGTWGRRLAGGFYAVWLALQVWNWWIPYLFGAGQTGPEVYARLFGNTHRFLPPIAERPAPDSNHVVLHILLMWGLVSLFDPAHHNAEQAR